MLDIVADQAAAIFVDDFARLGRVVHSEYGRPRQRREYRGWQE